MQVVDIEGKDVRGFLRHALANNVDKLKVPGKALYSCLLNEQGGVIDDLIAYFFREDLLPPRRELRDRGEGHRVAPVSLRSEAAGLAITPRSDLAIIAIQGPNARARYWDAYPAHRAATEALKPFNAAQAGDTMVARTGYTGEDGFEIVMPATAPSR
jgi:aminomethyltransferase